MFRVWLCCLIIFLKLALSCFSVLLAAPNKTDFKDLNQALEDKNYSEALIEIQRLRQKPEYTESADLIYNLGLSEWHLGQYGSALALLRQSHYARPYSLKNHKTLTWALKNLEDIQNAPVRKDPLIYKAAHLLPETFFFYLSLVPLLIAFYFALRNNRPILARLKHSGLWLFVSSLIFSLSFYSHKIRRVDLATQTLHESISAFSGPSEKSAALSQILPGDAVQILKYNKDWLQIKTSDLPSAWVKSNSFKIHNRLIDPQLSKP